MNYGIIYKITNTVNGKIYIGQTIQKNPMNRWNSHKSPSKRNLNLVISRAILKHGSENFTFEVIDFGASKIALDALESYYIAKNNSLVPSGYNCSLHTDGKTKSSPQTVKKQSIAMKIEMQKPERLEKSRIVGLKNRGKIVKNSKSKYVGVKLQRITNGQTIWRSDIKKDNKSIYLGCYKTEEDAAKAYDLRALEVFGENCFINFPELKESYLNNEVMVKTLKPKLKNLPKGVSYISKSDKYRVRINSKDKLFKNKEQAIDYLNSNL